MLPVPSVTVLTMCSPKGTQWYTIGRDSGSDTDIYIDIQNGISRCHLQVGFDEWGQVVVKDTSTLGCEVTYQKQPSDAVLLDEKYESAKQGKTSKGNKDDLPVLVIPLGWTVEVHLGDSETPLKFQPPDHSSYREHYRQNVLNFKRLQNNPLSFWGGLALNSQRAVTRSLFTGSQRAAQSSNGKQGRYAWIIGDTRLREGTFGDVLEVFNTTNGACVRATA